eukprot:4511580-Amphidinium_carterae.1
MAQPMRFLEEVCEHIHSGNFRPDETRSGRWGSVPSLMGFPNKLPAVGAEIPDRVDQGEGEEQDEEHSWTSESSSDSGHSDVDQSERVDRADGPSQELSSERW